ncbi:MAG: hypothetical protein KBD06_00385 [Candidatus Pacebacteria bacterium]|nr:hypothetical protein [Candidatus Paceibacterota bacterium]
MVTLRTQGSYTNRPHTAGVTLIDTIVGTALMLVVFMGITAAFQLTVDVVSNSKARAGAIALDNERMEFLKSLSYSAIGVVGGIPSGIVPQTETVVLNGVTYTRRTLVYYSDDPADGLGVADTNNIIADYKTIRVEVSWRYKNSDRSIQVVGRVSPQGVETAVPGGTLTINVVDANAAPLRDAQIDITNNSTTPAVSIRTFTNELGSISFIGAPAASDYQIVVSKTGYSTAQTYTVSTQNPNPNPRHLTVSNNLTTSYTFAIDLLATKTIQTYKAVESRTWTDLLSSETFVATTSNTTVSAGEARLIGPPYGTDGFILSTDISTTLLNGWRTLSWVDTTPPQTDIVYSLYTMAGGVPTLIPNSDLPGNAAGFASSSIDISALSTSTYPAVRIGATLISSSSSATPSIDSWAISYTYGPEVFPSLGVTVRGLKTIGNSPTVYKYNATSTSDGGGRINLPSIEWDTYTIDPTTMSGFETAEVCAPQPELLSPGASQITRLYVATNTPRSLVVDVRQGDDSYIQNASVQLFSTTTDTTLNTSACGQVYFPSLSSGTYTLNVSKTGFQPQSSNVVISTTDARASVVLTP